MIRPNTLIFIDMPASDPDAAARFYAEVLGWDDDPRSTGRFHRMVPGGFFPNKDGSDSEVANLQLGIYDPANARPYPEPGGAAPRVASTQGRRPRVWVLVGEGQSEATILDRAVRHGAEVLWRDHYWTEFNGYNAAFRDPWGNEIVLWTRAGPNPKVPRDFTRE